MLNKIAYILSIVSSFIVVTAIVTSCGVTNNNVNSFPVTEANNYKEIVSISENRDSIIKNIKANISLDIRITNKNISTSAHLQCKKGEIFKLTIVPFPLITAAQIWFDNKGIHLWDKINNVKIEEDYISLSDRLGINLSYPIIESIFLGRLFIKDIPQGQNNRITKCQRDYTKNKYTIQGYTPSYIYQFILNNATLVEKMILNSQKDIRDYAKIDINSYQEPIENVYLPSQEHINVYRKHNPLIILSIDWNKTEINTPRAISNIQVSIPNNVTKVTLNDILKNLNN